MDDQQQHNRELLDEHFQDHPDYLKAQDSIYNLPKDRICLFDCETTGLPKNWKAPMQDLDNWPRVIQLAWMVCDKQGVEISRNKHLIFPYGWTMPTEKFWIENGFTQDNSVLNGKPIEPILNLFKIDLNRCSVMASHNLSFDYNVVGAEMIRAGVKVTSKLQKFCTKESGTNLCKIPGQYNSFKWPKLSELYKFLFSKDFEGAHDALNDVIALKECFFELVNRKVIVIQ